MAKKKKKQRITIKQNLCFILGGAQQYNFQQYTDLKQCSVIVKQSLVYQCTERKKENMQLKRIIKTDSNIR